MKRMKALFGQRRVMVLATLTILVLAAAALAASSASFTASASNGPNVFSAGELLTPTVPGSALFTVSDMKPGDVAGPVDATVTNPAGSVATRMYLSGVINTTVANYDAGFTHNLLLTVVEDPAGANRTIVAGLPLDTALTTAIPLNNSLDWVAGNSHVYRFSVEFYDNGVNGAGVGNDNGFMNDASSITLTWNAVAGS